ncbi:MAG TPA: L-histidine N(alpha)-methyltransferase [Bryobacteraceae bacterium]|nr:L-histidine N(alpha)-methyltransferase [Bryobacteraceae bacterium]
MSAQGIQHALQADFIRDVQAGLGKSGQKELPSSYLYDEIGAALFEAITLLPEYGLARGAGFSPAIQWTDEEWPFAESLLMAS